MTPQAYIGKRKRGQLVVTRVPEETRLTPERSLELANHSPSGFEVGYCGSGPAQLALALLLDYTDDEDIALAEYMEFKAEVVSQLDCSGPDGCWRLTEREIETALHKLADEPVALSAQYRFQKDQSTAEHSQQFHTSAESTENNERQTPTEYVERSDVGVSLTVKLKRETGTRDQDEVIAKAKGKTLEDAREDMESFREYIHDLAEDARQIQPGDDE